MSIEEPPIEDGAAATAENERVEAARNEDKTQTHYDALGVSEGADEAEIKAAFRRKAMEYHPDKQTGKDEVERRIAEERFKNANNAYEALSDPERRSVYDRMHQAPGRPSEPAPARPPRAPEADVPPRASWDVPRTGPGSFHRNEQRRPPEAAERKAPERKDLTPEMKATAAEMARKGHFDFYMWARGVRPEYSLSELKAVNLPEVRAAILDRAQEELRKDGLFDYLLYMRGWDRAGAPFRKSIDESPEVRRIVIEKALAQCKGRQGGDTFHLGMFLNTCRSAGLDMSTLLKDLQADERFRGYIQKLLEEAKQKSGFFVRLLVRAWEKLGINVAP